MSSDINWNVPGCCNEGVQDVIDGLYNDIEKFIKDHIPEEIAEVFCSQLDTVFNDLVSSAIDALREQLQGLNIVSDEDFVDLDDYTCTIIELDEANNRISDLEDQIEDLESQIEEGSKGIDSDNGHIAIRYPEVSLEPLVWHEGSKQFVCQVSGRAYKLVESKHPVPFGHINY